MKLSSLRWWLLLSVVFSAGTALAANEHDKIKGPFKTGPDVTKACLECHQKQAHDFMKTVHWTWVEKHEVPGKGMVEYGKKNAINNFCIALPSNEPRCTSCHAGYGWKDAKFDFSKMENIDCLICHDTTGTYKKFPVAAGHPVYEEKEFPPKSGKIWKPADLEKVAKSVGFTSRASCGSCHFFGGGGDHVKHGDLDSSLAKPQRTMDVHMAADGNNMACSDCHQTENHVIPGQALSVSASASGGLTLDCTDCHAGTPHKNPKTRKDLNRHVSTLACQTCHIPTYARTLPTKVWWDWSTAGQDKQAPKDKYGQKTYDKMKGDFVWAKDVKPVYMWFNGTVDRYLAGEKIDPAKVTHLNYPRGAKGERGAKITPFKIMKGKQPYDAGNMTIAVPHLFGGYWKHWDWNKAIADGMVAAALPYSGKFGWTETDMYWKVNHMVVPKDKTLTCNDCHATGGRMDWKALGYAGDPKDLAKK